MSESSDNGPCGGRICPPRFPIFPLVFPLFFPIGLSLLMKKVHRRRHPSLKDRLSKIEERMDALTEKLPPSD